MIDINTIYSVILNSTSHLTCPTTGLEGIALDILSFSRYCSDDTIGHYDMTKITFNVATGGLDNREVIKVIAQDLTSTLEDTPYSLKTIHLDTPSRLTFNARKGEVRSSKGEQTLTLHIKG